MSMLVLTRSHIPRHHPQRPAAPSPLLRAFVASALILSSLSCREDRPPGADTTVARVDVTAAGSSTIPVGGTVQLTADAFNAAGLRLTPSGVTWDSENEVVATVDSSGLVTGQEPGSARITATMGGKTGGLDVTITPPPAGPLERVEIVATVSPSQRRLGEIGLAVEDVVSLMARGYDAQNNPILILHADWSATGDAAMVTTQGLVQGVTPGEALVGVAADGKTDSLRVYVAERNATFKQVEPGIDFTCGVAVTNVVYCWGDGTFVGNGIDAVFSEPMPVATGELFTAVAAGSAAACGVGITGTRHCWGYDPAMSNAIGGPVLAPAPVTNDPAPLVFVTLADRHACGLTADGTAYCWGSHEFGQIGDGTPPVGQNTRRPPTAVAGGLKFKALSAGNGHTCGVTLAGAVYCWGYNSFGRLGGGSQNQTEPAPVKVAVVGDRVFTTISAGYGHSCALEETGAAWCWGWTGGFGTTAASGLPIAGHTFREISAGTDYTCAIDTSNRAWCWGDANTKGEQGTGDNIGHTAPVRLQDGNISWDTLRARDKTTCGIASGTAFCWGANEFGQLGDGTRADRNAPVGVKRQL
jgi:alpha-tubulin suppressor-like RCC1 family protein